MDILIKKYTYCQQNSHNNKTLYTVSGVDGVLQGILSHGNSKKNRKRKKIEIQLLKKNHFLNDSGY